MGVRQKSHALFLADFRSLVENIVLVTTALSRSVSSGVVSTFDDTKVGLCVGVVYVVFFAHTLVNGSVFQLRVLIKSSAVLFAFPILIGNEILFACA